MDNEQSANGDRSTVYFLQILAIFILVVGWINYINLSTAKALDRAKEVGLRKVVGANRKQLITQFLIDTIVIHVIAITFASVITLIAWASFESLTGKEIGAVVFETSVQNIKEWIVGSFILILVIVLVGLYPALLLSSFNPAVVLKGKFSKTSFGTLLRKSMISFQYTLAVLLVAGTVTIYRQLTLLRSAHPGFEKGQIIVVEAPSVYDSLASERIRHFKNNLKLLAGITNVTASCDVPGKVMVERSGAGPLNSVKETDYFETFIPGVDTSFFSTYGIQLLKGRFLDDNETMTFRLTESSDPVRIIVNQKFEEKFNLSGRKEVLHEKIRFWWGPEERVAEVIGVVANHHQESLKNEVQPMMYMLPAWSAWKYFSIHTDVTNADQAITQIKETYARSFPDQTFSYFFLNDFFNQQYSEDQRFEKIFNVFTVLAVFVTLLGLIGLSIFSVTRRTKEMAVRKVSGAPVHVILFLFARDFMKLLLIAYMLAAPLIYFIGNDWLENFSTRVSLGWQPFIVPAVIFILITIITVFSTALKAAIQKPVNALRQE
jgi:putative ABC transport system permease protein